MSDASRALEPLYGALAGLDASACTDCGACCHMPWVLDEESPPVPVRDVDGTRFLAGCDVCVAKVGTRCGIYGGRPLDCRLFPLDLIEHAGELWWCIFLSCRHPDALAAELIPRIPAIEAAISPGILAQFRRQVALTRVSYPPYAEGQYRLVRPLCLDGASVAARG